MTPEELTDFVSGLAGGLGAARFVPDLRLPAKDHGVIFTLPFCPSMGVGAHVMPGATLHRPGHYCRSGVLTTV